MKRLIRIVKGLALLFGAGLVFCALLRWQGLLLFPQEAAPGAWEVFGVDVSSYQGEVDWSALVEQGVKFAFCKATEGSGHVDPTFQRNWQNAREAGVLVGAYHFFSYDSPGETQAENFIAQVPVTAGTLPPVVDIEFYGEHDRNPPSREEAWAILRPLLERLEEHYGVKPILYATYRSYKLYLAGEAEDYPLWITRPIVGPMDKPWTFWQYSHSARLEGYVGKEERIDLDVFRGSLEELKGMTLPVGTKAPAETPPVPAETDQPTGEKDLPTYSDPITAFYDTLQYDESYGCTPFFAFLMGRESDAWKREARNIFAYLKENAHPKLESSYLGLDLEQFEEDFFSYVEAQSYLDAYIDYTDLLRDEGGVWEDYINRGTGFSGGEMQARTERYRFFVTQWYEALNWGMGKTALNCYVFSAEEELSRLMEGNGLEFSQGEYTLIPRKVIEEEETLGNPIDDWVSKWLYQDGTTVAMASDAYREARIWSEELCHAYEVMAAHANPAAGLSDDIETARETLIEVGWNYGNTMALAIFSNTFDGANQEDGICEGSGAQVHCGESRANYYRHETLRLWSRLLERLGWDQPTWVFEPKEHERELDPSRNPDLTEWEREKLQALESSEDVCIWFDEERMYFEPLQYYTNYNLLKTPPGQVRVYARRQAGEISVEVFCQEDYGGPTIVRLKNGTEEGQEILIEELEIRHGGIGELTMADANFDGESDLLLFCGGNRGCGYYALFLWNEEEREYIYEPSFSDVTSPVVDVEHQIVWGGGDPGYSYWYHAYELIDGVYVRTHTLESGRMASEPGTVYCEEYEGDTQVGRIEFEGDFYAAVEYYASLEQAWEGWAWCDPRAYERFG